MSGFIKTKLSNQQLDTKQLKSVKGGGWGNGDKEDFKNCPPPFDPYGKQYERTNS